MRLLEAKTQAFHEFDDSYVPAYAILSHRWEDEEVTYQELKDDPTKAKRKKGFKKIQLCCRQALRERLDYAWIDTCCIDKTSSAELSEAINSMYRWYRNAAVCYAYLSDVQTPPKSTKADNTRRLLANEESAASEFIGSKWWTRGWTLQELIAPQNLKFFGNDGQGGWAELGGKRALLRLVRQITGIPREILRGADVRYCSIAMRMSWASDRKTTRLEDLAYCLLGVFDVNMPLLYGEGKKAFLRLQEEIMKQSDDHTLFAWQHGSHYVGGQSLGPLASDASQFRGLGHLMPLRNTSSQSTYAMTHKGLRIDLPIVQEKGSWRATAILYCSSALFFPNRIALPLVCIGDRESSQYVREAINHGPLGCINSSVATTAVTKTILIKQETDRSEEWRSELLVRFSWPIRHYRVIWNSADVETHDIEVDDLGRSCYFVPSNRRQGAFYLEGPHHSWLTILFNVSTRRAGQLACKILHRSFKDVASSPWRIWSDRLKAVEADVDQELRGRLADSNSRWSHLHLPNRLVVYANIALKIVGGESMVVLDVDFSSQSDAPREPYELEAIPPSGSLSQFGSEEGSRAKDGDRSAQYDVSTLIPPKPSILSKAVSRAFNLFGSDDTRDGAAATSSRQQMVSFSSNEDSSVDVKQASDYVYK